MKQNNVSPNLEFGELKIQCANKGRFRNIENDINRIKKRKYIG